MSSLRPEKLIEHADGHLHHAQVLYDKHESVIRYDDRILAGDRMLSAREYRHGIEQKPWLARTEQAKLYSERAEIALKMVKGAVENAIEYSARR